MGALIVCCALVAGGCGDDSSAGGVQTADPARTFAPIVHLHPDERLMPADPLWFIARSALWFGDDGGCRNQKISVGKRLAGQQNAYIDWTFVTGLGHGPAYWREALLADCETDREAYRYYANQRTRPHDDGPGRAPGLRLGEGYYLDLMDWAREGDAVQRTGGRRRVPVPVYYQSRPAEIDGEPGLRLTYWLMFAMNEQPAARGRGDAMTHEGDWERVEVRLRGDDGEYEPVAVRLSTPGERTRELPWSAVRRVVAGAGARTHPVLLAARGSHTLYARPGRQRRQVELEDGKAVEAVDVAAGPCDACASWPTWQALEEARRQPWYGFGGAWGDRGPSDLTTGPLGPHGDDWPKGDPADDHRRARANRRLRRE
ncbi:MAG TPA: hypothetical protein VHF88_05065 [Thermoleophilaceae bacterium]|nr:hypothetical protein [Thermoleophilaceae bacterium]